jgi:RNA polymerase sigma-70 factor (ECF subfamily)
MLSPGMSSHTASSMPTALYPDESALIAALRQGDERAFAALVEQYHAALVRLAMVYVSDRAAAEDAAQETWLGVLRGLARFEGRSSLKTWIFTILTNRAKTRAQREARTLPFSALDDPEADEPSVAPERFLPPDHPRWPNEWAENPDRWANLPEERLLSQETLARIRKAIEALPPTQRQVITLRDVEGWSSGEVCNVLEISETNQRVLLHRARSKVRQALERYFAEGLP